MELTAKQRDTFRKMFETIWTIQEDERANAEITKAADNAEAQLDYLLQLIRDSADDVQDFDEDNIPF